MPNIKPVKGQIGPYSLVCELGSGGMGTVFVARRSLPGGVTATVALKTLKSRTLPRPNLVEMFLDEVKIIARISHPYVCSVRDLGVADGVPYVAMDYLVGEPLSRVIPVLGSPPDITSVQCSVRLIADLCEGLHAAHELRDEAGKPIDVVHRDISPDNLFVLYDGTVRVVDFGIACTGELQKAGKTKVLAGKCAYMSPEQLRTKELDRRSDVWSMGVVLWEMLTGRGLFHRQSDLRTAVAVLEGPLEPPSRHNPHVPSALDEVVLHALSREPEQRPASARELARELESVLSNAFGPVPASKLGNWLSRLFPGSHEFRRRIVAYAAEAQKSADVPDISPEILLTRELGIDVLAAVENDRARSTVNLRTVDIEETTNAPITMMWQPENAQRPAPLADLSPSPALSAAADPNSSKSLISEWLDEQSSPIFTKEPLVGFERKRSAVLPGVAVVAVPSMVEAATPPSEFKPSPLPVAPDEAASRVGSRKLIAGSALLGVLTAAAVWLAWPKPVAETRALPPVATAIKAPEPPARLDPTAVMQAPATNLPEPTTAEAPGAVATPEVLPEPSPAPPVIAKTTEPVIAKTTEPVIAKPAEPVIAKSAEPVAKSAEPVAKPLMAKPAADKPAADKPALATRVARPKAPPAEASGLGKVYVMSRDPEVTVLYNGKPTRLPAMLTMPAGTHLLQIQRAGQLQLGRKVEIKAGSVGLLPLD